VNVETFLITQLRKENCCDEAPVTQAVCASCCTEKHGETVSLSLFFSPSLHLCPKSEFYELGIGCPDI